MRSLLLIPVLAICAMLVNANPIVPAVLSEITVGENGYDYSIELELSFGAINSLDNVTLHSNSGYSSFDPGIPISEIILITQDDLLNTLFIDPTGDYVYLEENGYMLGYGIAFGDHPESEVTAPFDGESIVAQMIYMMGNPYTFYWDVKCFPPTPLDSAYQTSCRGTLSGYVFDKNHDPIPGVELRYCHENCYLYAFPPLLPIYTNNDGYFYSDDMFGKQYSVKFYLDSFLLLEKELIVEIDSNNYYEIVDPDFVVGMKEVSDKISVKMSNYPNPFANHTTFDISIPDTYQWEKVRITIIDMNGRAVDRIDRINDHKQGSLELDWLAPDHLKSGIYIYSLGIDNKQIASNKMILLNE